jgi:hypothetical protein
MTPFFFDRASLQRRLASVRPDYVAAEPFPHCVIDDFVPASVLEQVLAEFPDPRDAGWSQTRSGRDRKLRRACPTHPVSAFRRSYTR